MTGKVVLTSTWPLVLVTLTTMSSSLGGLIVPFEVLAARVPFSLFLLAIGRTLGEMTRKFVNLKNVEAVKAGNWLEQQCKRTQHEFGFFKTGNAKEKSTGR